MPNCCAPNANVVEIRGAGADNYCAVTPAQTHTTGQTICPVCGEKGKSVDTQTVKAMLNVSLAMLTSDAYRFCRNANCEVVYFGNGSDIYGEDDLRERVHQKHPNAADVFVCYCFRHTPDSIRQELLLSSKSIILEQINAGVLAGQCACEIRNPQGSCCLGNVQNTVKHIQASLLPLGHEKTP